MTFNERAKQYVPPKAVRNVSARILGCSVNSLQTVDPFNTDRSANDNLRLRSASLQSVHTDIRSIKK
jgi:hypothetical protein